MDEKTESDLLSILSQIKSSSTNGHEIDSIDNSKNFEEFDGSIDDINSISSGEEYEEQQNKDYSRPLQRRKQGAGY